MTSRVQVVRYKATIIEWPQADREDFHRTTKPYDKLQFFAFSE